MVLPQEIIRRKRDGYSLPSQDIYAFIEGVVAGTVSEGQIAAFAMATYFKGMSVEETTALTLAMRDSGETLRWLTIDRPIVDKHSTGGVGDNVSLILAPLVAACGLAVPMISGRGLGHTGGTLDKLQSIAGYNIGPEQTKLSEVIKTIGCAIVSPTGDIASADRIIYAIRDVTSTVDSLPLITASILSKKLAAGLQSLVLDVKCGSGAFMQNFDEAQSLMTSLVNVANNAGVKTSAVISDMNEPLANAAGNALEVQSALSILKGDLSQKRLWQVTRVLAVEMLLSSDLYPSQTAAALAVDSALSNGSAMEHFAKMVAALGGPADFIERSAHYLPAAQYRAAVRAKEAGWLSSCDARELGMSVVQLGGGRRVPTDKIDHRVGISNILPLGSKIESGDEIAIIHASTEDQAQSQAIRLATIWEVSGEVPNLAPIIF